MQNGFNCSLQNNLTLKCILLEVLLGKQESMWKQISHNGKLRLGDHNTQIFHQKFHYRRRRIKILVMQNDLDETKETTIDIANIILASWWNITTTQGNTYYSITGELFLPIISDDENQKLICIPSFEKIYGVIKPLNSWKVPIPYGFSGEWWN